MYHPYWFDYPPPIENKKRKRDIDDTNIKQNKKYLKINNEYYGNKNKTYNKKTITKCS